MKDIQAIRRAYRKGQEKEVTVTRVYVQDSIEEYILHTQKQKFDMLNEVLGEADDDSHSNNIDHETLMPVEELYKLFRSDVPPPKGAEEQAEPVQPKAKRRRTKEI